MIEDIMRSIAFEIRSFEFRKGNLPEKIFVSMPLFYQIQRHRDIELHQIEFIRLFGIPVQLYPCDEEEYYLAEKKGEFRKMPDDINQLFIKETLYKKEGAEE